MADFKKMYYTLFRAQVKAKAILDEAEKKAEAMFIDSNDPIKLVDFADGKHDNEKNEERKTTEMDYETNLFSHNCPCFDDATGRL